MNDQSIAAVTVLERRLAALEVENRRLGGLLLVATGSFLGEGFDCPPLDTLSLAFPIAFKGRVVQYVGRVLRPTDEKATVEVHDYVDTSVPMLARMHTKHLPGFASLGFDTCQISGVRIGATAVPQACGALG